MGNRSSTSEIRHNLDAANLWAQYRAKTTRKKLLDVADEQLDIFGADNTKVSVEAAARKRRQWASGKDRRDSDPATGEGRSGLS